MEEADLYMCCAGIRTRVCTGICLLGRARCPSWRSGEEADLDDVGVLILSLGTMAFGVVEKTGDEGEDNVGA